MELEVHQICGLNHIWQIEHNSLKYLKLILEITPNVDTNFTKGDCTWSAAELNFRAPLILSTYE